MATERFRRTVPPVNLVVNRSSWRLIVLLVLSAFAVLLSIDILVSHRWAPAPATYDAVVGSTTDANGNPVNVTVPTLTADGQAHRRRDLGGGGVLLVGGLVAMGYSVSLLVRPRPVLRATDEGIAVSLDGWGHPLRLLPWEAIAEVRSGVRDQDGSEAPVLSIHVSDPSLLPMNPAGGDVAAPWLHLWADDWDSQPHQLAPHLDPATRGRRPVAT